MHINEALQIWFCFFHKFLKAQWKFFYGSSFFKSFLVVKIEQIIATNGIFAAKILQYPQKFVSVIRYVDKIIQNRKNFLKNVYNLKRKTLIIFDHFFIKFPNIFCNKFPNICPMLIGRLIFIQGIVIQEGSILIKKYKKKLIKNTTGAFQSNYFISERNIENKKSLINLENKYSGIEFQNIKLLTRFNQFRLDDSSRLIFTNVSLIGKMASLCKIGENITLWGIIRRTVEKFSRINKDLRLNVSIEAVSIFFGKKKQSNVKKVSIPIYPLIDFLLFSQDSKIKENDQVFIKKLFSKFLSRQFSEFFKTVILFSLLGGNSKKSLIKLDRDSINIGFLQNFFGSQYNLFFQIRKFLRNSVYILNHANHNDNYLLCGHKIAFSSKKKKNLGQLLKAKAFFFLDYIDIKSKKNLKLLNTLFYKKSPLIFYKGNKFKISKPFSLFAILKLPQHSIDINLSKNYDKLNFKKIFSLFDILIYFHDHILIANSAIIPLFFPIQNSNNNLFSKNLDGFVRRSGTRSLSILNITKYINFLKSFKSPLFSSGAEKLLILWYLSETFGNFLHVSKICFLEKVIKFSQTNTKLYNRDIILIQDTVLAISFIEKLYFKFNPLNKLDFLKPKSCSEIIIKNRFMVYTKTYKLLKSFKSMLGTNLCNGNLNLYKK